ncbi:hypothetical protein M405DRAFT_911785, partial [Rhizopogon salebrosus TDB-379]
REGSPVSTRATSTISFLLASTRITRIVKLLSDIFNGKEPNKIISPMRPLPVPLSKLPFFPATLLRRPRTSSLSMLLLIRLVSRSLVVSAPRQA